MFSVSETVDGITYTISGATPGDLIANLDEVDGLSGLTHAVAEETAKIAARALAPIAADDQAGPQTTPGVSDELADLIRNAPDTKTLESVWRAHRDAWNDKYNKIADLRKQELARKAKESK